MLNRDSLAEFQRELQGIVTGKLNSSKKSKELIKANQRLSYRPLNNNLPAQKGTERRREKNLYQKIAEVQTRISRFQIQTQAQDRINAKMVRQLRYLKYIAKQRQAEKQNRNYQMPMMIPMMPVNIPPMYGNMSFQNMPQQYPTPMKRRNLKRLFRVAAYAVYFSIIFPKYSRTLTYERFDAFKGQYKSNKSKSIMAKNFSQHLFQNIEDSVFDNEELLELDDFLQVSKEGINEAVMVRFLLKMAKSLQFLKNFISSIFRILKLDETYEKYPILMGFLAKQYIPDFTVSQQNLKYLKLHPVKNYVTLPPPVIEFLMVRFVFQEVIDHNLVFKITERYYIKQKKPVDEKTKSRLYFSSYVRNVVLQQIINLILKRESSLPTYKVLKPHLLPYPTSFDLYAERQPLFVNDSRVFITKEDIESVSQAELNKINCEEIFADDIRSIRLKAEKVLKNLFKKQKQRVMKIRFRKQPDDLKYFQLHTRREWEELKQQSRVENNSQPRKKSGTQKSSSNSLTNSDDRQSSQRSSNQLSSSNQDSSSANKNSSNSLSSSSSNSSESLPAVNLLKRRKTPYPQHLLISKQ